MAADLEIACVSCDRQVLAVLRGRLQDVAPAVRAAIAASPRGMVVDRPHPIDEHLRAAIPELLQGMSDPDRCASLHTSLHVVAPGLGSA